MGVSADHSYTFTEIGPRGTKNIRRLTSFCTCFWLNADLQFIVGAEGEGDNIEDSCPTEIDGTATSGKKGMPDQLLCMARVDAVSSTWQRFCHHSSVDAAPRAANGLPSPSTPTDRGEPPHSRLTLLSTACCY